MFWCHAAFCGRRDPAFPISTQELARHLTAEERANNPRESIRCEAPKTMILSVAFILLAGLPTVLLAQEALDRMNRWP